MKKEKKERHHFLCCRPIFIAFRLYDLQQRHQEINENEHFFFWFENLAKYGELTCVVCANR